MPSTRAAPAAITPATRLILVETVSNPTLRVADMEGIVALARGLILVVDNTFTTPAGYRAWDAGADVVVHSVTKLMAGQPDVTLGYVVAQDAARMKAIYDCAVTFGFTPSPDDCWLTERGLYTFDLRFDRAQETAAKLADFLAGNPAMAQVLSPGRADHPDHIRAVRLMGDAFGNMVSFGLHGGEDQANALVHGAPQLAFAPTLGDVGTTPQPSAQQFAPCPAVRRGCSPGDHGRIFPRVRRDGTMGRVTKRVQPRTGRGGGVGWLGRHLVTGGAMW
jgi:cystathionine gamma-synthase